METTAFDLLDEPWIRVMTHDRQIRELSLTQALLQSHEYRRLAGAAAGRPPAGGADPRLFGTLARPVLAVPSGAAVLSGAGRGRGDSV